MNEKTASRKTLQAANGVAFVAVLVVNFLSNALPLNGLTAGEISDALPSYFTPAGYTFSIWGLIYTALFGFVVYQATRGSGWVRRIGWLFVASSVANIGWLFAWHYGVYALSIVMMVSLLVILALLYRRLRIGRLDPNLSLADRAFIHLPFSLYLGWITVATVANVASVAAYWGWDGFGIPGQTWAALMILVATGVAGLLLANRRNLAYAGVLIWAFLGVRAANPDIPIIAITAIVASILVASLAGAGYVRSERRSLARTEFALSSLAGR